MTRNRRTFAGRRWVRPVDWDAAGAGVTLATGQGTYDWLRIPSDTQDPLQNDLLVRPKTLVKTVCFWDCEMQVTNAHTDHRLYFGIIPWNGRSAAVPSNALDVPDVRVGSNDWVMWFPNATRSTIGNTFGNYTARFTSVGNEMPAYISKAQRKLPPGVGLLWICQFDAGVGAVVDFTFNVRMALKGEVTAPGLGGE